MKTVSNIPVNTNENKPLDLLIEVSDYGISLMWFLKIPFSIKGIQVYVFDRNDQVDDELGKILNECKKSSAIINQTHLYFNYNDSVIIPEEYHADSNDKELLELMYGLKNNFSVATERTLVSNLNNTYRFPEDLTKLLSSINFSVSTQRHSDSIQIKNDSDEISLYCIVFYDAIKIILHREGKLQYIHQYEYSTPDDVLYHLLNVCLQYQIAPADTVLKLSGMIIKDSLLFNHLYNHFKDIHFMEISKDHSENEEIIELPLHFFTHLTELAKCV